MPSSLPPQAEFSATLLLLGRAWRRQVEQAIGDLGLSEATAWPLVLIRRLGGGIRQGALAEALGIEGPSLVRLLDQLCAAGFVERRDDPSDRRARSLYLTAAGEAQADAVDARLDSVRAQLLAGVSAADLDACLRVFRTVSRAAGAPPLAAGADTDMPA